MLKRYFELRDHIDGSDPHLACFLPSANDALKLKSPMESLPEFECVSLQLHRDDGTKCASRALFQALLQKYPSLEHYLGDDGIVHSPVFENAWTAFQQGDTLTESQRVLLANVFSPRDNDDVSEVTKNDLSFAESVLARRRKMNSLPQLDWVPVTSNMVARLFSGAKYFLSQYRKNSFLVILRTRSFRCVMKFFGTST